MELLYSSWPWYVSGPLIASTMFLLILSGKKFGMSSNLRTVCAIGGGGKVADFFRFDWKSQIWNLVVVAGAIIGGFIAHHYLTPDPSIALNPVTVDRLQSLGFENAGSSYLPQELFSLDGLSNPKNLAILLIGGFLVGFGARYAGGCTSGHAISGLSNLQLPSLIAVIGFFIGGLTMIYFLYPLIFG
ncbi:MAG: YeeE/YedE family protein [Saprospiraceae bacterium]|nr:YeeE/YedE family protein [Saprospiraceae bacterium]